MYIREDQIISPEGNKVDILTDLLNVSDEVKNQIKNFYFTNIISNCISFQRSIYYEGNHVRMVTKISYPSIEQFDNDQEKYRQFFHKTSGITTVEMLETNGYKHQLLYEDIV